MSIAPAADRPPAAVADGPVRVRHQARAAVTLMAFSALTSVGLAGVLLVLATLVHQG
jgi:hypothetical protein